MESLQCMRLFKVDLASDEGDTLVVVLNECSSAETALGSGSQMATRSRFT